MARADPRNADRSAISDVGSNSVWPGSPRSHTVCNRVKPPLATRHRGALSRDRRSVPHVKWRLGLDNIESTSARVFACRLAIEFFVAGRIRIKSYRIEWSQFLTPPHMDENKSRWEPSQRFGRALFDLGSQALRV